MTTSVEVGVGVPTSGWTPDERRTFSGGTDGQAAIGSNAWDGTILSNRHLYASTLSGATDNQYCEYIWQTGDEGNGNWIFPVSGNLGVGDKFWFRWRVQFPSTFDYSTDYEFIKALRVKRGVGGSGHIDILPKQAVEPAGTEGWALSTELGGFIRINETLPYPEDQWFYIEGYILGSTSGTGVVRGWLDGTFIGELTSVNTLSAGAEFVEFGFIKYWNGLCPANQSCYVDEFVLAINDNTPPNTDAGGRTFIGGWTP